MGRALRYVVALEPSRSTGHRPCTRRVAHCLGGHASIARAHCAARRPDRIASEAFPINRLEDAQHCAWSVGELALDSRKTMKRGTLIGIVVAAIFACFLLWSTLSAQKLDCEACIEFAGKKNCAKASGTSEAEALRTAVSTPGGPVPQ